MANQTLILKGIVGALQVGLIILLVITGIYFKDVKTANDLAQLTKKLAENSPDYPQIARMAKELNIKYLALLTIIILSTLKVPVIAAGLFLDHIWILFGSFLIDNTVGVLYFVQWGFIIESYRTGSWSGILGSLASGIMTVILIRFIRKQTRYGRKCEQY